MNGEKLKEESKVQVEGQRFVFFSKFVILQFTSSREKLSNTQIQFTSSREKLSNTQVQGKLSNSQVQGETQNEYA